MRSALKSVMASFEVSRTSEADSVAGIKKAAMIIDRLAGEVVNLAREYAAEMKNADELMVKGLGREYALSLARARNIHEARCRMIERIAAAARLAAIEAARGLIIDETTAGTGLEETSRRMVSEVSGWCSRW